MDADLHHMSWRRFQALFSGLSPDGAVARALSQRGPESNTQSAREAGLSFIDWLGPRPSKEAEPTCSSAN